MVEMRKTDKTTGKISKNGLFRRHSKFYLKINGDGRTRSELFIIIIIATTLISSPRHFHRIHFTKAASTYLVVFTFSEVDPSWLANAIQDKTMSPLCHKQVVWLIDQIRASTPLILHIYSTFTHAGTRGHTCTQGSIDRCPYAKLQHFQALLRAWMHPSAQSNLQLTPLALSVSKILVTVRSRAWPQTTNSVVTLPPFCAVT